MAHSLHGLLLNNPFPSCRTTFLYTLYQLAIKQCSRESARYAFQGSSSSSNRLNTGCQLDGRKEKCFTGWEEGMARKPNFPIPPLLGRHEGTNSGGEGG